MLVYAGKETSPRSASDDVRKLDDPITPIVNAELLDSTCIPYRASAYRGRNYPIDLPARYQFYAIET